MDVMRKRPVVAIMAVACNSNAHRGIRLNQTLRNRNSAIEVEANQCMQSLQNAPTATVLCNPDAQL
eukprot:2613076-Lingulodinium_polyedra.AAC.1